MVSARRSTTDDRRGSRQRHRLSAAVSLVAVGDDDLMVRTGSTVNLSRLGCSIVLDEPITEGQFGARGVVVLLAHDGHEAIALTGPPLLDNSPTQLIRLTLSAALGIGAGWDELIAHLDRRADPVGGF